MACKRIAYCFLILGLSLFAKAQGLLTLDVAIRKGLEKNNDVVIYRNLEEIAKVQNNPGNAGMSPSVGLSGNYNFAGVNSHQVFNNGTVQDRDGAASNNLGTSLNVVWTVFDGLKMFAVKKRLELNQQLSALALKQQLENTVFDIIVAYYDVVRINELIKAAGQNLLNAAERKKVASLKFNIGSDSKVDLLMSQVEENRAQSEMMKLELDLLSAKTRLNVLLNNEAGQDFATPDTIVLNEGALPDELKRGPPGNNSSILFSKQNELLAEQSVREARASFWPQIQLNGALNYTRNESQAGIIFLNRQAGFNAGISASWLLFNGGKNKHLVQERNIAALNQKLNTEQTGRQVEGIVFINYKAFELTKKLSDMERLNVRDSQELFAISMERYRIGKTNLLETMEAQKSLREARVKYIEAMYASKVAETELMRAAGSLVK